MQVLAVPVLVMLVVVVVVVVVVVLWILLVLVLLLPVLLVLRPRFRRVRVAWEVSGWWWSLSTCKVYQLVYRKHEYLKKNTPRAQTRPDASFGPLSVITAFREPIHTYITS
jgi:beta-lactamase regulating signal transducer with metallopeptidase domain